MGSCLSVIKFARDMQRAQREEQNSRVIVNYMMIGRGPSFGGPFFTISTRQNETKKEQPKEEEDAKLKAMRRWAEMSKPTAQFLMLSTRTHGIQTG